MILPEATALRNCAANVTNRCKNHSCSGVSVAYGHNWDFNGKIDGMV